MPGFRRAAYRSYTRLIGSMLRGLLPFREKFFVVQENKLLQRSIGVGDVMLTEENLLETANSLSQVHFGAEFRGTVGINTRLRTSAGRYLRKQNLIEVNPEYVAAYGEQGLLDTLRHELIHYHYPDAGHGQVFRREAARIGCSRFCSPLPGSTPQLRYVCRECGKSYLRRRRVNMQKYRCGACMGILCED